MKCERIKDNWLKIKGKTKKLWCEPVDTGTVDADFSAIDTNAVIGMFQEPVGVRTDVCAK